MDATRIDYLDPAKLRFFRRGAALRITVEDRLSVLNVALAFAFPLSGERFVSVRDGKGQEIGVIRDVSALDPESRSLVRDELRLRYIRPVIQRVLDLKERFGSYEWTVQTDRGPWRFATWNLNENVHRLPDNRRLIVDVDTNTYELPDPNTLDAASRRLLREHVV